VKKVFPKETEEINKRKGKKQTILQPGKKERGRKKKRFFFWEG